MRRSCSALEASSSRLTACQVPGHHRAENAPQNTWYAPGRRGLTRAVRNPGIAGAVAVVVLAVVILLLATLT
jgi:hypothetical protein